MKRMMFTTALATLLAGPVLAQSQGDMPFLDQQSFAAGDATDILATDLIGKPVYVTAEPVEGATVDVEAIEWERVGDVNDIVLTSDGVQAVVLDIGGFLGMGEKQVAMDMDNLHMASGTNDGAEIYLVFTGDRAAFESAGEFDLNQVGRWAEDAETEAMAPADANDTATADSAGATDIQPTEETAQSDTMQQSDEVAQSDAARQTEADRQQMAQDQAQAEYPDMLAPPAPAIPRDQYDAVAWDTLTTEDLTGTVVYDVNDQNIGEIDRLFVSEDGRLNGAVLDVGGFLGLGEKPVLVDMDSLSIQRNVDGELLVHVDVSRDQLETMESYQG